MPVWFPFALMASFLVMLGSGSRSGWKLAADQPQPPPPPQLPPKVQGLPPRRRFAKKGDWPYQGLPFRVTLEGRLFQKGQPLSAPGHVMEPHALYNEVGGQGKIIVLGSGRFVAAA